MQKPITALITAAGESSRMGSPKALLKFKDGRTLLEDQIQRVVRSGVDEVFVVVGCEASTIIRSRDVWQNVSHRGRIHGFAPTEKPRNDNKINFIENKNWEWGHFSSIHCGVNFFVETSGRTSQRDTPSILLLPVDVVGVEDEVMRTIVEAGVKNRATIIPTFQGKGGHPVFLCPEAIKEILKQDPKTGRLDTILKMRSDTRRIEVASGSILNNVNTPDEWEKHENNLWHGS